MSKQFKQDFGRRIVIHVCKDGTISYRDKTVYEKVFNDRALPVFSVDTVQQAKDLQVMFGRAQYVEHPQIPGHVWYKWTDFSGDVADLAQVTERCRMWWYKMVKGA